MSDYKLWPKAGSKISYKGTHTFWFTNIIQDAKDLLELGKEYTVKDLQLASSWCGVILEEFPEKTFALSFFTYPKELTTEEVMRDRYVHTTLEELKNRIVPKVFTDEEAKKLRERFQRGRSSEV